MTILALTMIGVCLTIFGAAVGCLLTCMVVSARDADAADERARDLAEFRASLDALPALEEDRP